MERLKNLSRKLENNGFQTAVFSTKEEAKEFVLAKCRQKTVGTGGSVTLTELGILPKLQQQAKELYARQFSRERANSQKALTADVFLLSANAVSEEDGTLVNIDNGGNRLAASVFGPSEVIFIIGKNKLCQNVSECLKRIQTIAPLNAKRLGSQTPCAVTGKCSNCNSPDRICRTTVLQHKCAKGTPTTVVLVDENLGL